MGKDVLMMSKFQKRFPKFTVHTNKCGNIVFEWNGYLYWTLGYSKHYGGYFIRRNTRKLCSKYDWPFPARQYFNHECWVQNNSFPLNYNRKTGNYMFKTVEEMLDYFEKYLSTKFNVNGK